MTNETIRKKIEENPEWKVTLRTFEERIGKVDFCIKYGLNCIMPDGRKGSYSDMLTLFPLTSMESFVAFLHGVLEADQCVNLST